MTKTQSIRASKKRVAAILLAAVTAFSIAFPSQALAVVSIDGNELANGTNNVGGGTATLCDKSLDMENVTANDMHTDQDLSINFNGGNDIEVLRIDGSANVDVNFEGENEVEDTHVYDDANVTVNANGHNDFEEIEAHDNSEVTVNVTGKNDFETIEATENANITVKGTDCQKRDIVTIGDEEHDTDRISAENGNVTIDHVTVELDSPTAVVGSKNGNLTIDTSKITSGDEDEYVEVVAGNEMNIHESVLDIVGTMHSGGLMVIDHSDVKVSKPDSKYDDSPYRVYSKTGIELKDEKNGTVKKDDDVWYLTTDDDDDDDDDDTVHLKANGDVEYYTCSSKKSERASVPKTGGKSQTATMPKTGDDANPWAYLCLAISSLAIACYAAKRRYDETA